MNSTEHKTNGYRLGTAKNDYYFLFKRYKTDRFTFQVKVKVSYRLIAVEAVGLGVPLYLGHR